VGADAASASEAGLRIFAPAPPDASTVNPPIILIVTPSLQPDGRKAYNNRGQLFDGKVDGRTIITRSTQPLLDGCRVLVREGLDPDTRIIVRHAGSTTDALRSTVRGAAKLAVSDDILGKPIVRRWQPYNGEIPLPGSSPMRQTEPAATRQPGAAARSAILGDGRNRHANRTGRYPFQPPGRGTP
jgi:hypothetical protein